MAITALSSIDCRDAARLFFRAFPSLTWTKRRTLEWIKWHNVDRRAFARRDESGQLVGFSIVRCLDKEADASEYYTHSENGPILWVETLIGSRSIWREFCRMAVDRFGPRDRFGFARFRPFANSPRFYPYSIIHRL